MADSLEEVICETLKSLNVDFSSCDDVKKNVVIILEGLLDGNYDFVPQEDGAINYIKNFDKEMINMEIRGKVRKNDFSLEDYAEYIIKYIEINNINNGNINNIDMNRLIDDLKVDNNLKEHFKSEVKKGNVDVLHGYVGDDIIDKYRRNLESKYSFKK